MALGCFVMYQVAELREQHAAALGEGARGARRAEDAEARVRELQAQLSSEQRATQVCLRLKMGM